MTPGRESGPARRVLAYPEIVVQSVRNARDRAVRHAAGGVPNVNQVLWLAGRLFRGAQDSLGQTQETAEHDMQNVASARHDEMAYSTLARHDQGSAHGRPG